MTGSMRPRAADALAIAGVEASILVELAKPRSGAHDSSAAGLSAVTDLHCQRLSVGVLGRVPGRSGSQRPDGPSEAHACPLHPALRPAPLAPTGGCLLVPLAQGKYRLTSSLSGCMGPQIAQAPQGT